jgi:hypothetical protein
LRSAFGATATQCTRGNTIELAASAAAPGGRVSAKEREYPMLQTTPNFDHLMTLVVDMAKLNKQELIPSELAAQVLRLVGAEPDRPEMVEMVDILTELALIRCGGKHTEVTEKILEQLCVSMWNEPAEDSPYAIGGHVLPDILDKDAECKIAVQFATVADLFTDCAIHNRDTAMAEAALKKANGNRLAMLNDLWTETAA